MADNRREITLKLVTVCSTDTLRYEAANHGSIYATKSLMGDGVQPDSVTLVYDSVAAPPPSRGFVRKTRARAKAEREAAAKAKGGGRAVLAQIPVTVENPWLQLPNDAPHVLPEDRSIIEAFNARHKDTPYAIQAGLLPEPFIGDPKARVYLLNLNPGYEPEEDDRWHAQPDYQEAIRGSLSHRPANAKFPFYFLDRGEVHCVANPWDSRESTSRGDLTRGGPGRIPPPTATGASAPSAPSRRNKPSDRSSSVPPQVTAAERRAAG